MTDSLRLWSCRIRTTALDEHTRTVLARADSLLDGGLAVALAMTLGVAAEDVEILSAVEIEPGSAPVVLPASLPPVKTWTPEDEWPDDAAWLRRLRKATYDARYRAETTTPRDGATVERASAQLDRIKLRLKGLRGN